MKAKTKTKKTKTKKTKKTKKKKKGEEWRERGRRRKVRRTVVDPKCTISVCDCSRSKIRTFIGDGKWSVGT